MHYSYVTKVYDYVFYMDKVGHLTKMCTYILLQHDEALIVKSTP